MPATTPPDATSASPTLTQQIGHYEILAKIGEGGMGEVYRARDTRLNRNVAIKVLPRAFAEGPYRMARFEREAQLLASLNHPKIAAIYGLEESGATRALVMELVEGPTLAEQIGRTAGSARPKVGSASPAQASGGAGSGAKTSARSGAKSGSRAGGARKSAIPIDEALLIAQQVAEALEYAHEHGVVHRDLKPANIKVTPDGDVKVLDFGLAKAMGPEDGSGDMSNSPTLSLAMTEAGLIIGTAAYMAPEQAKGNVLRLTLLRSPPDPDPVADQGVHHFVYALYPHAGTWKHALTERQGWDFNYKLDALQVEFHAGILPAEYSFFGIDAYNVVLTALKKAEDSNALILRFYEWAGKNAKVGIRLPKGITSASLTNLMESPEGAPLQVVDGDRITVPTGPYDIVTVRASYTPQKQ